MVGSWSILTFSHMGQTESFLVSTSLTSKLTLTFQWCLRSPGLWLQTRKPKYLKNFTPKHTRSMLFFFKNNQMNCWTNFSKMFRTQPKWQYLTLFSWFPPTFYASLLETISKLPLQQDLFLCLSLLHLLCFLSYNFTLNLSSMSPKKLCNFTRISFIENTRLPNTTSFGWEG